LSIPAVAILGFGLASIYPTALGIAGARFAARSGTVFGMLFTFGLVGGMTLPFAAGQLAARSGLRAGLALAPVSFLAIALLACLIPRLSAAVKE
jgi:fucose permease